MTYCLPMWIIVHSSLVAEKKYTQIYGNQRSTKEIREYGLEK